MRFTSFRRRVLFGVALWLAVIMFWIFAQRVEAQQVCLPRADIVNRLTERFGETLQSQGLHPQGVMEVFTNTETGTWTFLLSRPDGMSCMISSGDMWMADASPLTPQGDPL